MVIIQKISIIMIKLSIVINDFFIAENWTHSHVHARKVFHYWVTSASHSSSRIMKFQWSYNLKAHIIAEFLISENWSIKVAFSRLAARLRYFFFFSTYQKHQQHHRKIKTNECHDVNRVFNITDNSYKVWVES